MVAELCLKTWEERDSKLALEFVSIDSDLIEFAIRLIAPCIAINCTAFFSREMLQSFLQSTDWCLEDCDHRVAIGKKKHPYRDSYSFRFHFASSPIDINRQLEIQRMGPNEHCDLDDCDEVRLYRRDVQADEVARFLSSLRNLSTRFIRELD